jgi:hypothetical protein
MWRHVDQKQRVRSYRTRCRMGHRVIALSLSLIISNYFTESAIFPTLSLLLSIHQVTMGIAVWASVKRNFIPTVLFLWDAPAGRPSRHPVSTEYIWRRNVSKSI